ncbi:MarR family transcriptional regulator [Rhodospirillaceae bacterium SYSU D60014]|uniref:MarR family winged helix-turn-helix transcriptional regulator n=1 Tax=Virgifigura deserti TaxID=2268457 RepID=UPI000E66BB1E
MSNSDDLPFEITLKVRDTCLCLHVRRAARTLARRFDEALRPLDLTSGQFSLMMSLNRPEPPTIGSVSALLAMDRTTLTANLKPLERRGLVKVMVDEADKRSRRMALTPAGRALLAAAYPRWERTQAEIERLVIQSDSTRPDSTRAGADAFRINLRALS